MKIYFLLFVLLGATSCYGDLVTFTSETDFNLALTPIQEMRTDSDFEGSTLGGIVSSGSTIEGLTLGYDFGGVSVAVVDGDQFGGGGPFNTTSGTNFLGTDDGDVFQDGDSLSISFSFANAVGMQFISADALVDGDITLAAGGGSVGIVASSGVDLGDGGFAYYLGLIDSNAGFTSATITADGGDGGPFFFYTIDDITTASVVAVPEPSSVCLFSLALLGALTNRRRRKAVRASIFS